LGRREVIKETSIPLTRDDVVALSERVGDPDWLRERRLAAWALSEALPVPSVSEEAWRRTDIRGLRWNEVMKLPDASAGDASAIPADLTTPLIGDKQGGLLVFAGGKVVRYEFSETLAKQGVIFTDLATAAQKHPDILKKYFMAEAVTPEEDKLTALHAALWTHGVLLYVPKGVAVDLPLHSVEYAPGTEMTGTHILVVVEEDASVTYLHENASPTLDVQTLHLGVTELIVRENANLRYVALQNWGEHVYNFGHQRARVGRSGQLDWVAGEMGTRMSKIFMTLDLEGDGAWGRMSGLFFTHNRQHLDLDTQQNHRAVSTTSDLLFKGALKGHSRTVWQGMIVAEPGAQKTDGFQANRNLLLEPTARADSIPGLEIQANDLRCTHAATVGKIDDVELFYLQSRGISTPDATRLIVDGFFDPLMQRIPFEGVRERLQASIDQKMMSA
jgi:Fe-S cluster assembly protein SufD